MHRNRCRQIRISLNHRIAWRANVRLGNTKRDHQVENHPASTEKLFYKIYRRFDRRHTRSVPNRGKHTPALFQDLYLIGPGHYEYELRVLPEDVNVDVTDILIQ